LKHGTPRLGGGGAFLTLFACRIAYPLTIFPHVFS
jgi:hypothetical protein